MTRFLVISSGGHALLLAAFVVSGSLLSKPRMSYYAIDLASSLPSGGGAGRGHSITAAPAAPPTPPSAIEERKLPAKDVIRVPAKKNQVIVPKVQRKPGLNLKAALAALGPERASAGATGHGGPGLGGGTGITADVGEAFPYPWYLKQIADRLNDKWRPPRDFQSDMLCQIGFVIHRDGQVTDAKIEQSSGDSMFDQLAHRAVLYANPLPPLPAGFPDEMLRVHMKFLGKPL